MRIEDLPPWAQAQAANQIMARQRRNNGRSRPPSPALPDDEEEMPRRAASKYHNRKAARITAAGNILEFDSQKEARRYDELALLLAAGNIRNLKLQPEFTLQEAYTTLEGRAGPGHPVQGRLFLRAGHGAGLLWRGPLAAGGRGCKERSYQNQGIRHQAEADARAAGY